MVCALIPMALAPTAKVGLETSPPRCRHRRRQRRHRAVRPRLRAALRPPPAPRPLDLNAERILAMALYGGFCYGLFAPAPVGQAQDPHVDVYGHELGEGEIRAHAAECGAALVRAPVRSANNRSNAAGARKSRDRQVRGRKRRRVGPGPARPVEHGRLMARGGPQRRAASTA